VKDQIHLNAIDTDSENQPSGKLIELMDMTISIAPSRRKTVKLVRVTVQGKLTIKDVDQFMKTIKPLQKAYEMIEIILEEISTIDLSFIQALYHIKNSRTQSSANVTATFPIELKKNISNAGFNNFFFQTKHA
jgi:hypothetical protein